MNKKVLIVSNNFIDPSKPCSYIGGGDISSWQLINYIKCYYDISVLCCVSNVSSIESGINVNLVKVPCNLFGFLNKISFKYCFKKAIAHFIEDTRPSIIIGSTIHISSVVAAGVAHQINSVIWLRAYENIYDRNYYMDEKGALRKANKLIENYIFKQGDINAIQRADLVLTNSRFMKNTIYEQFHTNAKVVYPPIDINFYNNNSVRKVIGFINPTWKKGVEVFNRIVKNMPDFQFICFGGKQSLVLPSSNVHCFEWISNIKKIYSSFNLLIVPSIGPEAFGRVAAEALAAGIPVIVSKIGGLPEVVNNNSKYIIENVNDINEWDSKIRNVFNSNESLNDLKDHILRFSIKYQGNEFKNALDSLLIE